MKPALARRARMKWDAARGSHVLLVPEGVLMLNEEAAEILQLCDGTRSEAEVLGALAESHPEAERDTLARDLSDLLKRLVTRGFMRELE